MVVQQNENKTLNEILQKLGNDLCLDLKKKGRDWENYRQMGILDLGFEGCI